MPFLEEPDLADMLSDAGVDVTWRTVLGAEVKRQGLYRRQTENLLEGVANPETEEVPSVLVELAYYREVKEGDPITVDTPDGTSWMVRQSRVEMRSLLRIYLAAA
jgi:hypothetical protein